jgi:hypothetical protein
MEDVNSQSIKALVGKLICYLGTRQQALNGLFLNMESQSPSSRNGGALRPHICFFRWDLSDTLIYHDSILTCFVSSQVQDDGFSRE